MSVIGVLGLALVFAGVAESPAFNGLDFAGWVLVFAGVLVTVFRAAVSAATANVHAPVRGRVWVDEGESR